jgi:hypothetical protein
MSKKKRKLFTSSNDLALAMGFIILSIVMFVLFIWGF